VNSTNIDEIVKLIKLLSFGIKEVEDGSFGSAFTFSGNDYFKVLKMGNTPCFSPEALNDYISQVEKNRNKFIRKHKKQSIPLSGVIIINLILSGRQNHDLRFLNTGLKIIVKLLAIRWLSKEKKVFLDKLLNILKEQCVVIIEKASSNKPGVLREFTDSIISRPHESLSTENTKKINKKIVVFSPNMYSIYTLSTLYLLKRNGFDIEAVIVRRLFNIKRIHKELTRDGIRLVKKVIRKLILKDSKRFDKNGRNLSDVKNELNISDRSVYAWCKENHVKLMMCNTLNDSSVVTELKQIAPDYGVFTGGGIISSNVIKCFNQGILNCHCGILPHYRGMDVIEWPTLLSDRENSGLTVHFMSNDIDEGEIIYGYRVENEMDVISMRYEFESYFPYLQVKSLLGHATNTFSGIKQTKQQGVHYYVMHPWLFNKSIELSSRDLCTIKPYSGKRL
jgi:methionyl-tRNA formyltransferase